VRVDFRSFSLFLLFFFFFARSGGEFFSVRLRTNSRRSSLNRWCFRTCECVGSFSIECSRRREADCFFNPPPFSLRDDIPWYVSLALPSLSPHRTNIPLLCLPGSTPLPSLEEESSPTPSRRRKSKVDLVQLPTFLLRSSWRLSSRPPKVCLPTSGNATEPQLRRRTLWIPTSSVSESTAFRQLLRTSRPLLPSRRARLALIDPGLPDLEVEQRRRLHLSQLWEAPSGRRLRTSLLHRTASRRRRAALTRPSTEESSELSSSGPTQRRFTSSPIQIPVVRLPSRRRSPT